MPSYPSTLPQPNKNGFRLSPKESNLTAVSESGNRRIRRKVTTEVYKINCSFSFKSKSEFDEFLKWLKYDTNYGNLWFNANWFSDIGFVAGEWVFKFEKIPFSHTGWSQKHNISLIMAPKNDNIVSPGVYVEKGVGGAFLNQDYPFGFELFEAERLVQNRVFNSILNPFDFNGSNITLLSENANQPTLPVGLTLMDSITPLSQTRFVYIAKKQISATDYEYWLVTYDYIDDVYTFRDSSYLYTSSYFTFSPWDTHDLCTLSSTEIAIISKHSFSSTSDIYLRKVTYNGTSWSQTGATLTIPLGAASFLIPSICALSPSRVAITLAGDNTSNVRLRAYDFGVGWTLVGSEFDTGLQCIQFINQYNSRRGIMKARSETEITINFVGQAPLPFTSNVDSLFDYTFNGSVFAADGISFHGFGLISMVSEDEIIAIAYGNPYTLFGVKRTGGVWAENTPRITSDNQNAASDTVMNGLSHFMWNV